MSTLRKSPRVADYAQALEQLYARIDYEKIGHAPYTSNHYRLDRMRQLLELLDNPHAKYKIVHIAGTKGKGTTATLVSDGLRACGLKTGLVTSPHLLRLEERIQFQGEPCSPEQLVSLADSVLTAADALVVHGSGRPTFFELTTAMGMLHAAEQQADCLVLEVGLGGRLDSTNVCSPVLSIITAISLDHQLQLGNTIAEIAAEKAGIIKPQIPVICTARHPDAQRVVQEHAVRHGSSLLLIERDFEVVWSPVPDQPPQHTLPKTAQADAQRTVATVTYAREQGLSRLVADNLEAALRVETRMLGRHQADNFAAALTAFDVLREIGWNLPPEQIFAALADSVVPARLQICGNQPLSIVDTAHNPASIAAALQALEDHYSSRRRIVVFGSSRDKDYRSMLQQILPACDALILTAYQLNPRALPVAELHEAALQVARELNASDRGDTASARIARMDTAASPAEAWRHAQQLAAPADVVLATGSFFLAAELLPLIASNPSDKPTAESV